MVLVGTILGTLVCMANMYFGWQLGSVNTMSAATALISYTIFKGTKPLLAHTFGPPGERCRPNHSLFYRRHASRGKPDERNTGF